MILLGPLIDLFSNWTLSISILKSRTLQSLATKKNDNDGFSIPISIRSLNPNHRFHLLWLLLNGLRSRLHQCRITTAIIFLIDCSANLTLKSLEPLELVYHVATRFDSPIKNKGFGFGFKFKSDPTR